jgi:hypothetical protein
VVSQVLTAIPIYFISSEYDKELNARDKEWVKEIERHKTIIGIQIFPSDWAMIKSKMGVE